MSIGKDEYELLFITPHPSDQEYCFLNLIS